MSNVTPGLWHVNSDGDVVDSQGRVIVNGDNVRAYDIDSMAFARGNNLAARNDGGHDNTHFIAAAPATAAERDDLRVTNTDLVAALKFTMQFVPKNFMDADNAIRASEAKDALATAQKKFGDRSLDQQSKPRTKTPGMGM